MVTGIMRGPGPEPAGDRRRAILDERADDFARGRQLHRREQARQHGVDVGARHRELGRPEVVHRMAERVDAVAVDVRHGAGAAQLQVAARRASRRRRRPASAALRTASRRRAVRRRCRRSGRSPARGTRCRRSRRAPARSPDITSGVAIGRSSVPSWPPPSPATALTPVQLRVARTIGERPVPVERLAKRRREVLARQRVVRPARARPAAARR